MQFGRFWLAWLVRLFRGVGRSVAGFEWFAGHDAGPQFAVGCEHPVVTGEIDPWPGNQGREPGEQVQRFEEKVGRAVGVGVLECIAQLAVVCLAGLLKERITILSFIFTRCNDVNGCPLASYVLQGVQQRVAADEALRSEVQLVSVSFDPSYDTPEVVSAYGDGYRMENSDWHFLTATDEHTLQPILDAYDQSVVKDYDDQGNFLGSMSHILRVFLIDRERRIRNIYSVSYLHADTLANDIRTVLGEG